MHKTLKTLAAATALAASAASLANDRSAEQQFLDMMAAGDAYPVETLMPLFKQLEPVDLDFMVGTWKGGKFDGGAEPDPINWYGKRFTSPSDVEPLLVRNEEGDVVTFDKLGAAQMRMMAFDGMTSAALIYDTQPIMDYFRRVNDDVVIGLGDIKGKPLDFFFHLTRE